MDAPRLCRALLAAAGTALCAGPARAQLVQQYFPNDVPGYGTGFGNDVVNRMLNEHQPQGIQVGSILIKPYLSESGGYATQVLGVPGTNSTSVSTSAGVSLNTDWTRNALGASLNVSDNRYIDVPQADFTNWSASVGGSVSLGLDSATLGYSHLAEHLGATDLGVFGIVDPVGFSVNDVRLGYGKLFGRFTLSPSFEYENVAFGTSSGGTTGVAAVNYTSLSHDIESGTLTGRYALSAANSLVAILRGSGAQFVRQGAGAVNDYTDAAGFLGIDVAGDAVVRYRALVGVESRQFAARGLSSSTTPTFELDVTWTPTQIDTVTLTGVRRLDDPSSPFASNQTITDGRVQLDHELHHDIYLNAYGEVGSSSAPSNQPGIGSRSQIQLRAGAGATWYVNRYVSAGIGYGYANSASGGGTGGTFLIGNGVPGLTAYGSGKTTFTSHSVSASITLSE